MTTERQVRANQRNASRSTGPKSVEGKARVAQNALKHGLLSREALLPDEDEAEFVDFQVRLRTDLNPVGELETVVFEQVVSLAWRLRRSARIESGLLTFRQFEAEAEIAAAEVARHVKNRMADLSTDIFYDPVVIDQRQYDTAVERQRAAGALRDREFANLGRTFMRDERTFSALSRYETALERRLFKALHELERVQRARRGEAVPAPVAVDVSVDLEPGGGESGLSS